MKRSAIFGSLLAAACQSQQPTSEASTVGEGNLIASPKATDQAEATDGRPVNVASDPRAQYWVLSKRPMANGHLEVTTRRLGPSGESYARREVDCRGGTVRYIGEGDTLAEANADSPAPGGMTEPVPESITGTITAAVCA